MKKKIAAGIDIGGTNTRIGLVDDSGNVLADNNIATDKYPSVEDYVATMYNSIEILMKNPDMEEMELIGIGIGAPNANSRTGRIENAVNLPWHNVPLADMFRKYYGDIMIKITNDANAVAIAEMVYGNAKDCTDFVVITLGTGLGSGIVANGKMIDGHDGLAGEVGHITAVPDGRQCNCGRYGCLETYVSAPGLVRTALELLVISNEKTGKNSLLRQVSFKDLTSKYVYEAAGKGDSIAKEAFNITGKILGRCLADVVAFSSPSAIFIFGGLADSKEMILDPVKKYMEEYMLSCYKNKVQIRPSGLDNNTAGIVGGAALIWNEYIKED